MTHLLNAAVYVLEGLFAVGIIGSMVVVLLTTIEDATEVFEKDEHPEPVGAGPRHEHFSSVNP